MTLSLNRPEQRNAMVAELRDGIGAAIKVFLDNADARCLLITGEGGHFCAGGDVSSFATPARPAANRARIQSTGKWARQLLTCEKPVITAVSGAAAGAGFGLALLGDITLMADDAYFFPAFPMVGVCPDMMLGWTLVQRVGTQRAADILLRNRKVEAEEAAAIGLVAQALPADELFDEALALAKKLACSSRPAIGLTKLLLHAASTTDPASYAELESAYQGIAMGSADHAEGVMAFIEKRRPEFGQED
jgi:2-(1,2-epoxy-1,2-dihydrophenyl)acetyl-CoA isomerase